MEYDLSQDTKICRGAVMHAIHQYDKGYHYFSVNGVMGYCRIVISTAYCQVFDQSFETAA